MRCVTVLAFSVLITIRAAAQTPPAAYAPKWSIGDNWKYQELIDRHEISFEVTASANGHYAVVSTLENGVRVAVEADDTLSVRDFVEFRWPLAVGRSWESGGSSPPSGDNMLPVWRIAWTVTGYQPVAVIAGGFDAYRIDAHACAAEEGRCGDFSVWYAPKAKWIVKYALSSTAFWGRAAGRIWQLTKYVVH